MSVPLAVFGYTLLSIGFVLMKKGIGWIGFKGPKDRIFRTNLFVWIVGFIVMNLAVIPNTMALKHLAPHIVSSTAGWGVIVMVALSSLLLRERLFRSDGLYTILIVGSIVLLNLFETPQGEETFNLPLLAGSAALPFVLVLPAFFKRASKRIRTVFLAGFSGIATGMIVISLKVLVILFGFQVSAYFASPVLYLYLLFSLGAFVSLQAAYKLGSMMRVGPVQYSASIIYPVLCSLVVFGDSIHPLQLAAVVGLVFAVIGILQKH